MLSMTFSSEPRKDDAGRGSCGVTLFKKDVTRFWPLWTVYTALWLFWVPLNVLSGAKETAMFYAERGLSGWAGDAAISAAASDYGIVLAAVYGLLCAMAVWSYLFSSRSANMMHTLPIRREGHFAVHLLSGTAFFTVPNLVILLLTALAGAVTGSRGDLGWIAAAMGLHTLMCLFFFCFATLCAMITGHILALPAFFIIFNGLALGLGSLLDWAAEKFLFGFTAAAANSDLVTCLTPMLALHRTLDFQYNLFQGDDLYGSISSVHGIPLDVQTARDFSGAGAVAIYAAAGLILAALALLLYRRHHLETAGDVVSVPWLRPVFQYSVAFCAGLAGTAVLYSWLLNLEGKPLLILLLALCTAIGFFAARMFLQKSLRVFKSGWKGCAASVCVMLLLCGALEADLFGVERRVPPANEVTGVYLRCSITAPQDTARWPSLSTEDSALIANVLSLHQDIVDRRATLEGMAKPTSEPNFWENWTDQSFHVTYYLTDGSFLERDYPSLWFNAADLEDPDSLAAHFDAFFNNPAVVRSLYHLDQVDASRLTSAEVDSLQNGTDGTQNVFLFSPLDISYHADPAGSNDPQQASVTISSEKEPTQLRLPVAQSRLEELWQAVLDDFSAGNLGVRYLFGSSEERLSNTCVSDLTFSWQVAMDPQESGGLELYYISSCTVTLTPQATRTLAVLEELGVFSTGLHLRSNDNGWRYPT